MCQSFKRTFGPDINYPKVLEFKNSMTLPIKIAGPCFIENISLVEKCCEKLSLIKDLSYMRGGVFRAGTYPPADNFGLQKDLLKKWSETAKRYGLKIIVEVIDIRDLDFILQYADALQVGARQGQGYAILNEIGKLDMPVGLKRGQWAKIDEFLGATEYLLKGGKCRPFLIERGSVSFLNHIRFEPSISMISAIKKINKEIPIIIDGSHGTGRSDMVLDIVKAGIAAGANGYLIEAHPNPSKSLSDSEQAISLEDYLKFECILNPNENKELIEDVYWDKVANKRYKSNLRNT